MTVYRPNGRRTWRYDFTFDGRRYSGNTKQITKDAAELAERELRLKLRHQAGGIGHFYPEETPHFQAWAKVFLAEQRKRTDRPDHAEAVTRALMRFWGNQPAAKPKEEAPRHHLRLGDPIRDPSWILQFEDWMARRGIGAQSKNHYRGMLRRMYRLAMRPQFRALTGIAMNPFAELERDATFERTVALTPEQVRAWLGAASYHVRLAVAIAALAPKLRLRNVLDLQWATHFDPDPRGTRFDPGVRHYLTVAKHKTARRTRRPLVAPVSTPLLVILQDAYRRAPRAAHVVSYRGAPVRSITAGVKAALDAAGIPSGRARVDGATFHTIRHTAATLLSLDEANPLMVRDVIGHGDLATTLRYRHLRPEQERPAHEQLARTLQLVEVVTAPTKRARRRAI